MDILKDYVTSYGVQVISILAVMLVFLILWKTDHKDIVKRIVRELVCRAEKEFGSGTGKIKYDAVMGGLYNRLPFLVRMLFTRSELEEYIESAVLWLKNELLNGTNLLGVADEKALEIIPNISNMFIPNAETIEPKTVAEVTDIIPVINSIPPNIVINQEPIAHVEAVTPIVTQLVEMCRTCQNRKLEKGCMGCDGRVNYTQEQAEVTM